MPKTSSKKTTVKRTPRMAEAKPETREYQCGAECGCRCGCAHGKFKKFVVLLIVFALGFAVAKFVSCGRYGKHHMKPMMPEFNPEFVDGCLNAESIKCQKMQEMLPQADVNMDGCITVEEFDVLKKSMPRPEHRHGHRPHRM